VGDTVGDPFKDTSSVAMNPVIKFTTLFGLLAVELAVMLPVRYAAGDTIAKVAAVVCFLISVFFVWRSFYGMRIKSEAPSSAEPATKATAAAE
jgi:K(+)-stimulated pyrophosphate-energized sodium pump